MSDFLSTLQATWQQALNALQGISARAPGSRNTQALLVGALVGFLVYNLTKKRYRLPPGPFAWPLLGNILSMRSKEESFYVTLRRWAKEKYGPVITVYFGPIPCVTLNDLDVVTEALVHKGKLKVNNCYKSLTSESARALTFRSYTHARARNRAHTHTHARALSHTYTSNVQGV